MGAAASFGCGYISLQQNEYKEESSSTESQSPDTVSGGASGPLASATKCNLSLSISFISLSEKNMFFLAFTLAFTNESNDHSAPTEINGFEAGVTKP